MTRIKNVVAGISWTTLILIWAGPLSAASIDWNVSLGNWTNSANWSPTTVPGASDNALVRNTGTAQVDTVTATVDTIITGPGQIDVSAGSLSANTAFIVGSGAASIINHTGGSVTVGDLSTVGDLRVGVSAGGSGTYNISGGTLSALQLIVGLSSGVGTVNQSGGTVISPFPFIGHASSGVGVYNLSGGTLISSSGEMDVGRFANGTLNQTGGSLTATGAGLIIGNTATGVGVYNLTGGSVTLSELVVGSQGKGTLNLGNASSSVTIAESAAGKRMDIVQANGGSGTLNGWGTIAFTGPLFNHGRVIANGYGDDSHVLNLTSFSSAGQYGIVQPAGHSNGWFAVDNGKLMLPTLSITPSSTKFWGQGGGPLEYVHSIKMDFSSGITSGNLSISLLAPDRADVPATPDGRPFLGVWDFQTSGGFSFGSGSADLSFRFDDSHDQGADLKLWHHDGVSWTLLSSTFNDTDHTISTSGVNSFSIFALTVPEPSTVVLLALGSMIVFSRRQR